MKTHEEEPVQNNKDNTFNSVSLLGNARYNVNMYRIQTKGSNTGQSETAAKGNALFSKGIHVTNDGVVVQPEPTGRRSNPRSPRATTSENKAFKTTCRTTMVMKLKKEREGKE